MDEVYQPPPLGTERSVGVGRPLSCTTFPARLIPYQLEYQLSSWITTDPTIMAHCHHLVSFVSPTILDDSSQRLWKSAVDR
jgi:hypothetical protein